MTEFIRASSKEESFAFRLFLLKFNKIPSNINIKSTIDVTNFNAEFLDFFKEELEEKFHEEKINMNNDEIEIVDSFDYILKSEVILTVSKYSIHILIYREDKEEQINFRKKIIELINISNNKSKKEHKFYMVSNEFVLELVQFKLPDLNNFDTKDIYNDELLKKNVGLNEFINGDSSGLALFHGVPGTGKTNLIKELIKSNSNRKFIYIPTHLFSQVDGPTFIDFFKKHYNSILVIEDAEGLITSRKEGNGFISTLLNITDGLLGDALKLKVICTFNCSVNKIDDALKRKGRLKYIHEFKELDLKKSNYLLQKIGSNFVSKSPMTLTDILNYKSTDLKFEEQTTIGF